PSAKFSVADAIQWMAKLLPGGWREIRQRNHELAVKARRILCERLGTEPMCPESMLGSMATVRLPSRFQGRQLNGRFEEEQVKLYRDFGVEVPFLRIGTPTERYIRVSAQLYNTVEEYEYLAEALGKVGKTLKPGSVKTLKTESGVQGGGGRETAEGISDSRRTSSPPR